MKNITEGKLIKTEFGFKLNDLDGVYVASVQTDSLSLENCQAIELGYDLDELAHEYIQTIYDLRKDVEYLNSKSYDFISGFRKAIEILGDKNEKNIELLKEKLTDYFEDITDQKSYISEKIDDILQQTEWDVIIETTCDGLVTGLCMPEVCDCNIIPKLDSKGRMILKINK